MKSDVLIIGPICGIDIVMAEYLSRMGLNIIVLRRKKYCDYYMPIDGFLQKFNLSQIIYFESKWELLKYCKNTRFIVTFTASLLGGISWLWLFRKALGLPPVCNIATGADIHELINEKDLYGTAYRYFLKTVHMNWIPNGGLAISNAIAHKVPNLYFFRFPQQSLSIGSIKRIEIEKKIHDEIIFFHPSRIDWGFTNKDTVVHRNSNLFIESFITAIKNGLKARCFIIDIGPDVQEAKNIIAIHGMEEFFEWLSPMKRNELFEYYVGCDVVVSEFVFSHDSGLGGVSSEAISLGKPVMLYLNPLTHAINYPEAAPILNCFCKEDIYNNIIKCKDKIFLLELGQKAKKWSEIYFDYTGCLAEFLIHYQRLTGHKIIDYTNKKSL